MPPASTSCHHASDGLNSTKILAAGVAEDGRPMHHRGRLAVKAFWRHSLCDSALDTLAAALDQSHSDALTALLKTMARFHRGSA
jgi:hypothetical protein